MAIEGIQNAGMTYQGGSSEPAAEMSAAEQKNIKVQERPKKDSGSKQKIQELRIDDGKDAAENKIKSPTEALKKAVEEINKKTKDSEAVFGIHDGTNRVVIKIVDKDSREVLKEYPPEKTLDMIVKVWELAGLLVDEKG